jgi:hypothetical protein
LAGGIVGCVIGLVVGALLMFMANRPDPVSGQNDTVCAQAAERYAQLDVTWRDMTGSGIHPVAKGDARWDAMPLARGEALEALDACRLEANR